MNRTAAWLITGLLLTACSSEPTPAKTTDAGADTSGSDISFGGSDGVATSDGSTADATAQPDTTAADTSLIDANTTSPDTTQPDTASADSGASGCAQGCDDKDVCTDDACVNNVCTYTPNTATCDDGKACTGDDTCALGKCAGISLYWEKTFGGSGEDVGRGAAWLDDGSVFIVGHSDGGGVASTGKGGRDAWLLRIDAQGKLLWEQLVGNDLDQTAYDVARWDKKFATVGSWREHGDKKLHGWLHVTDSDGKALGSHVFGKDEISELHAVSIGSAAKKPTTRMVVAGYNEDSKGDYTLAVARIDPDTLKPLWVQKHGSSGFDVAWDVVTLHNGHMGLVGDTAPGGSGPHVWLLELDETGKVSWQRTYFSDGEDTGWSLVSTPDQTLQNKGYTVAGTRKKVGATSTAAWLMHADGAGKDQWQETATAPGGAGAYAVARTGTTGYLVAGRSAKAVGKNEALLWQTDTAGATKWSISAGVAGSQGHSAVVWSDAVGMVGQSGSGKGANLLVVRASTAGKLICK